MAPSCHIAALTFLRPCLGPIPTFFVSFVLLRHSLEKRTQVEVLISSWTRLTPAFYLQIYSVSLTKCQTIVCVNLCAFYGLGYWYFLYDSVAVRERNKIHYVWDGLSVCLSVSLTPFSFPLLDGLRPKNCVDFTEMVYVRILLFKWLCHNIFCTLAINVIYKTISSNHETSLCGCRTLTSCPAVPALNGGQHNSAGSLLCMWQQTDRPCIHHEHQ